MADPERDGPAWAERPGLSAARYVAANGIRLAYAARGAGLPCLLIHGFGEGGYVWRVVADSLAGFCRPIALDLRGHGGSDRAPCGGYRLADHVEDVLAAAAVLGLERFAILGHSLGAAIALQVQAKASERVIGIGLFDHALRTPPEVRDRVRRDFEASLTVYASRRAYAEDLRRSRPLFSWDTAMDVAHAALVPTAAGFVLRTDPAILREAFEAPGTPAPDLAQVRCPALILRGVGSAVLSAPEARAMNGALPAGELHTVPRAGHGLLLDNPEGSTLPIAAFVSRLASSAAF